MCDPPINQNSLQVGVKIESCCFMRRSMKGERVEKVKEEKESVALCVNVILRNSLLIFQSFEDNPTFVRKR